MSTASPLASLRVLLESHLPAGPAAFAIMLIKGGLCLGMVVVAGIVFVWAERKISARIQSRLGPMYTGGWHGWLQTLADGIKLALKEDILPTNADRPLFLLAPLFAFLGAYLSFAAIPYGETWIVTDLNIGIFYLLAVSSFTILGVIMAGWSSNNKWSLYGGMRAAAQLVSYEVPLGLALVPSLLYASSLNMREIVESQAGGFWNWYVFRNPFVFIAFGVYFIAALAELNRAPFDLSEAESELVGGYHTEYSGLLFSTFFIAEYANMLVVGFVGSILFLGGWDGLFPLGILPGPLVLVLKACAFVFVMIWLRWTLPRLRIDQMMALCWKVLLPITLICLAGSSIWMLVWPQGWW